MASAAEQLAANLNFAAIGKSEELKKRIWFTLGALIVYRLGSYIPIPGIDAIELGQVRGAEFQRHSRLGEQPGGRRPWPHGDLRPQHHALYFGVDHHSADDVGVAPS